MIILQVYQNSGRLYSGSDFLKCYNIFKKYLQNVCRLKYYIYLCNGLRTEPQPDKIGADFMLTNKIKDFFKSGDVLAFFVLAVVVVVLVAVFGTIEYTPTASEAQPIINMVSSGVTYMNL